MPDIAMCSDGECDSRKNCYRYMATPSSPFQLFADFVCPAHLHSCEYYMPIREEQLIEREE